eukprot:4002759-Alexandrium_andersonii.AAC.1
MSASLVGSEMCIRDRDSRAQVDSPTEVGLLVALISRVETRAPLRGGGVCLLYTSDAADDM